MKNFSWIFTLSDHAENIPPPRGNVNRRNKRRRKSMLGQKTLPHRPKNHRLALPMITKD
jgi:hypothetical protein